MRKAILFPFLGLTAFLLTWSTGHAQGSQTLGGKQENSIVAAKPGTFLLIRTGKVEEALNTELLFTIEQNRKENEDSYFVFSQNTLVKIISRQEISKPDFVPFEHLYMDEEKVKGATK